MLKLKYLFENYDLAKEALKNWEHDEDTLNEMLTQFRISSNAIYPFCRDGGVCFLRLAPAEEKSEKNVLGELEFINYLRGRGYPAMEPVQARTGQELLKLDTQWGEYYAAVFKKVKGVQIEDTELSGEVLYAYGKALGRLHALSAEFTPKTKKWDHEEVLDWIEGVLAQYNAPENMAAALAALRKKLRLLPREQYGLVHYDFEPDNVFYDEETGACSVIDFDDGMYHWYALDLEQVFGCLEEVLGGEALETAKTQFMRGYREEHPYTQGPERKLMRRFIDLYAYARLIRCVAEKFDGEPEWLTQLRHKLNRAIAQKEQSLI